MIRPEHQEKMFILNGTIETFFAEDGKGRSFTQILSSLCRENGGAVDILEIEGFVFLGPSGVLEMQMSVRLFV